MESAGASDVPYVYRLRERRLTMEPDGVDGDLSSLLGERGVG